MFIDGDPPNQIPGAIDGAIESRDFFRGIMNNQSLTDTQIKNIMILGPMQPPNAPPNPYLPAQLKKHGGTNYQVGDLYKK